VGLDELETQVGQLKEEFDLLAVVRRIACRKRCHRKGVFAEDMVRGPCEVGGIGSAGERHDQRRYFGQCGEQRALFCIGKLDGGFIRANLNKCLHAKPSIPQALAAILRHE
jgi:hypothetical protein